MATLFRRVGTADVDQSGKVLYWTGQALTPRDTDLALSEGTVSGGVTIPMQIKITQIGSRTFDSVRFRDYHMQPVQRFDYILGNTMSQYGYGASPYGSRFDYRPALYRYYKGWRFNQDMPANTLLYVRQYTPATEYYPTTEELRASTTYHKWPSAKKGNGGGRRDVNIADALAVPESSSFRPSVGDVVATYAFADTDT